MQGWINDPWLHGRRCCRRPVERRTSSAWERLRDFIITGRDSSYYLVEQAERVKRAVAQHIMSVGAHAATPGLYSLAKTRFPWCDLALFDAILRELIDEGRVEEGTRRLAAG